tara:strand:+ start:295 stop:489 length:195 start_codon:yes stop_codon:yes gene_type:complete
MSKVEYEIYDPLLDTWVLRSMSLDDFNKIISEIQGDNDIYEAEYKIAVRIIEGILNKPKVESMD